MTANVEAGEYRRAYESLALLRNTPLQAARDVMLITAQVRVEDNLFQASGVTGKTSGRCDETGADFGKAGSTPNGSSNSSQSPVLDELQWAQQWCRCL